MKWEIDHDGLYIGGKSYDIPSNIYEHVEFDERLIIRFEHVKESYSGALSVELRTRNVCAFTDATHEWTIEAAPEERPDPAYVAYKYLFEIGREVFCVHRNGSLYKIEAETGSLLDSWPSDRLPLGDETLELPGEIQKVIEDVDRVYVQVYDSENPHHCFDDRGRKIWETSEWRGTIHLVDGTLYEYLERGPRTYHWYRLDKDTGERIEETEKPDL